MDFKTLFRPGILGTRPYTPGKPISEVQRELGLDKVVKLASNENPEGPLPSVIEAVKDALARQDLLPHQFVMVSGIGQAAKTVHYLNCNGFNGLHGRALSPAQAIKLARDMPRDAIVLCNLSGRGDKDVHTIAAREGISL